MKALYGLDIEYTFSDVQNFFGKIYETKDEKQLDALYAFIEKHKLFANGVTQEQGGMDAMNQGNLYFHIGALEKSALKFAEALKELNRTVEPMVYFGNFDYVVDNYKKLGDYEKLMEILIKSRDFAATNKVYDDENKGILLKLHYLIATLSAEYNLSKEEGKKAKQYCINNYFKNKLFTLEEMKQLSI